MLLLTYEPHANLGNLPRPLHCYSSAYPLFAADNQSAKVVLMDYRNTHSHAIKHFAHWRDAQAYARRFNNLITAVRVLRDVR